MGKIMGISPNQEIKKNSKKNIKISKMENLEKFLLIQKKVSMLHNLAVGQIII